MKIKLLVLFTFIISLRSLKAQDFTIDGINYKIIDPDNFKVEVDENSCYTGNFTLPSNVQNQEETYTVTKISLGAFNGCTSLTKITIPNSVTLIEGNAFWGCSSLTEVILPDSINQITSSTFRNCSSLSTINLPNTINNIGGSAFWGCSNLKTINLPEGIETLFDFTFFATGLTSITLPNSLKIIQNDAFNGCADLANITIPDSVYFIGENAFKGCKSLTSITLPTGIDEIKVSTFEGSGLTTINIPNTITEIEYWAFRDCWDLITVVMDDSVTTIGSSAFQRCRNLTNVTLSEELTSIPARAFDQCFKLENITIPQKVTTISDYAFYKCYKLKNVFIPEGVININQYAFDNCLVLNEIEIPESVTTIENNAFSNSGLTDVTVNWITPLAITANVFDNINLANANLNVPKNTYTTYKAADVWKDFGTVIESTSIYTSIPDANFEQYLIDENIDSDGVINGQVLTADIETVAQVIVNDKNISNLTGIQDFSALIELNATNNQISNIDLSKNVLLEKLFIANNQLSNLDVSKNIKLKNIDAGENNLAAIDVHLLTELESLSVYKNQLTTINLISNTKLIAFIANDNQLKYVDIRENTALFWLDLDDNLLEDLMLKNENNTKITMFSITGNPNLTCIEVDDVSFSASNWTDKDATANYSIDCAPVNDDCSKAFPLTFGQLTPGDVISGTTENTNPSCAVGNVFTDVWYTVNVPNTGEFSIQGSSPIGTVKFAIYQSCASLSAIACGTSISLKNLEVGTLFYLRVWLETDNAKSTNSLSESGIFTLTANESSVLSVDNFAEEKTELQVYPNPATANISIALSNNTIIQKVEVYSILGEKISTQKSKNKSKITLDVSHLSTGIYFIKAKTDTGILSKKLIIK